MEEPVSRFEYLFGRYISNDFTAEERTEFLDLVRRDEYKSVLNALIENAVEKGIAERQINPGRADQLFEKIMQAANPVETLPVIPIVKRSYFRWVAAASIAALLIAGGYLFFFTSKQKQIIATNYNYDRDKNVIAPAGNKAVLTLDDGSTIILDSAANGIVTEEGSIKVVKLNNGKLAYQGASIADGKISYNTINTPRGGQYQVILPDGTKVWLNAASSLRFPTVFAGRNRKVTLTGEAYFEVANNKSMPFIVDVHQTSVEVLGTHFNINGYSDEANISTTLLEGSVKFTSNKSDKIIRPGQQAVYSNTNNSVLVQDADVNQVMSWKNGLFEFDNIDLPTIMRQISRWYDVDIIYEKISKDIKLGGGISRKLSLQELLQLLKMSGVNSTIEGKKVIVST